MSGIVRQITVTSDPTTPYFLRVEWAEDLGVGFTLALTDGTNAWIGEVSEEEVAREMKELRVEREEYVESLHQALTGHKREGDGGRSGGLNEEEVYSFHLSPDHSHLSYEKTFKGVVMHVGTAELQPATDPLEVNRELIGHTLERSAGLESENGNLLEENQRLKQEYQSLLKELEEHVQDKEAMEKELYSCFVMVLNEKKSKIRGLQDTLHHLQQTKEQQRDKETESGSGTTAGNGGRDDKSNEETAQSVTPSQAPTLLITGRNIMSVGLSMDYSVSSSEDPPPRKKSRKLHSQSSDLSEEPE